MQKLKLLSLLIATTISIQTICAQARQNGTADGFTKKSEKLTAATGWYQKNGKWISNSNMIADHAIKSNKLSSYSEDNFYWIQSGTHEIKGRNYHIFFLERINGSYLYPETQVDWQEFHELCFFAFDSVQFEELKQAVAKKEGKNIAVNTAIDWNTRHMYGKSVGDMDIITPIQDSYFYMKDMGMGAVVINSQTLNGKDIVRFKFKTYRTDKPEDGFKYGYFEVGATEFGKLLAN